jgi:hypothetical protein
MTDKDRHEHEHDSKHDPKHDPKTEPKVEPKTEPKADTNEPGPQSINEPPGSYVPPEPEADKTKDKP